MTWECLEQNVIIKEWNRHLKRNAFSFQNQLPINMLIHIKPEIFKDPLFEIPHISIPQIWVNFNILTFMFIAKWLRSKIPLHCNSLSCFFQAPSSFPCDRFGVLQIFGNTHISEMILDHMTVHDRLCNIKKGSWSWVKQC